MHEQKPRNEWIADRVMKTCITYYGVNIRQKTRVRHICEARQVTYYFLKKYSDMSLSSIAKLFNQNHATVLHAIKKISDLVLFDKKIRDEVSELNQIIRRSVVIEADLVSEEIRDHLNLVRMLIKKRNSLKEKTNVVHNN